MNRIVLALLGVALAFAGCDSKEPAPLLDPDPLVDELPIEARSFSIGTAGFVPRNWPNPVEDDWQDLFARLPDYGERFGVHVAWDADLTAEHIPTQVDLAYTVTAGTGTVPYIALGFEPDAMTQQEADTYFEVNGDAFREVAVAIAATHRPEILLLGVESNRYFEKSEQGYEDFIAVYAEAYDAIKAVSPGTLVATNLQYETMIGAAFLTGEPHEEHLYLIERFGERLDLITITTYPWLDFNRPADVPVNYFDALRAYTDRPLMITETGWPSEEIAAPMVETSEQAQIDYLLRLLTITRDESVEALIWVFPHDPNTEAASGVFNHVSLRENDGTAKSAYAYWQALRSL